MSNLGTKPYCLSLQPRNIEKIDNVRGALIGRSTVVDILLSYLPEDSIKSIIHGTPRVNKKEISYPQNEDIILEVEPKLNQTPEVKSKGYQISSSDKDFQVITATLT